MKKVERNQYRNLLTLLIIYVILTVMKYSRSLIRTLKEEPKEAETKGHRLLLRGGFIKQLAAGIHSYLPLGWRIILRISQIIREEMERIGAQELLLPAISPRNIWEESGRWQEFGDDMFRLKDRKGRDYCLCPTHEEIITEIARAKIKSYRDLPQIWFQIQTKFRDERRPRFGVIRSRQFIMKDSYSLDIDEAGLDHNYALHEEAYRRIFKRCGLEFEVVEASGGLMGGGESKEFIARIDGGEALIAHCTRCNFQADTEAVLGKGEFFTGEDSPISEVATPQQRTVEEVSDYLDVSRKNLVKSIFFTAPDKPPILILLRGDYEVNENIIKAKFGFSYNPASPEEIVKFFNAEPGFIGPVGIKDITIYADDLLKGTRGMITGANKNGYHIRGLNIDRDIKVSEFLNLRKVKSGDRCTKCGGKLELYQGLELGQIFKLGTKYSAKLDATFLDEKGQLRPIIMGSYGIGLERIMACACEQKADESGIVWPISIAPFEVYLLILNPEEPMIKKVADEITQSLTHSHFSIIIDDRDLSAGIKFNDSELLGIPMRVTIGPRGVKENRFDIYIRETKKTISCSRAQIVEECVRIKQELYRRLNV